MPNKYLVDVNLPKYFSFFNSDNFLFVADMDLSMSDNDIWNYAIENELTIVTKDADFYSKAILSIDKPKVVYLKLGNMLLKDLHNYFKLNWSNIELLLEQHTFIIAYPTQIEALKI